MGKTYRFDDANMFNAMPRTKEQHRFERRAVREFLKESLLGQIEEIKNPSLRILPSKESPNGAIR